MAEEPVSTATMSESTASSPKIWKASTHSGIEYYLNDITVCYAAVPALPDEDENWCTSYTADPLGGKFVYPVVCVRLNVQGLQSYPPVWVPMHLLRGKTQGHTIVFRWGEQRFKQLGNGNVEDQELLVEDPLFLRLEDKNKTFEKGLCDRSARFDGISLPTEGTAEISVEQQAQLIYFAHVSYAHSVGLPFKSYSEFKYYKPEFQSYFASIDNRMHQGEKITPVSAANMAFAEKTYIIYQAALSEMSRAVEGRVQEDLSKVRTDLLSCISRCAGLIYSAVTIELSTDFGIKNPKWIERCTLDCVVVQLMMPIVQDWSNLGALSLVCRIDQCVNKETIYKKIFLQRLYDFLKDKKGGGFSKVQLDMQQMSLTVDWAN